MSIDCDQQFDLAVVGAGAYGAAVAYEATTRGLRTFLADKGDFGSGTSANSLKIIHGGLRYLQNLDFKRLRSSTLERAAFLRVAPDLVRPLRCAMPTGWQRKNSRLVLGAGLALNAGLTFDRNRGLRDSHRLPGGGLVSRGELAELAPGLQMKDVSGGASWFDAIMMDSERLSLSMVLSARDAGAAVHNYLSVERLLTSRGSAVGVAVRDRMTGSEYEVKSRAVVSCQGPWVYAAGESPFGQFGSVGLLKAVNLILPNANLECAVGFPPRDSGGQPRGKRLLFAVPWHGLTMVGTWYFSKDENQDDLSVSPEELEFMLQELNSGFETWSFGKKDVLMLHIGQQPAQESDQSEPQPITAPLIAESTDFGGLHRSWIVQGEKWTTARSTAQSAVQIIAERCGFDLSESVSSQKPLYSGPQGLSSSRPACSFTQDCRQADESLVDVDALLYSLRHEMVRTLPDLLLRRTNIGAGGRPPSELIEKVSRLAASELEWDEEERLQNVEALQNHPMYPDVCSN